MFLFKRATAPVPRYQAVRGAMYTARRLELEQRVILLCCEKPVTLADLARATHLPAAEVTAALKFLGAHGLVRIL